MSVSIFIRSYRGDFQWLRYCLRSLAKFGHEFHEIVIVVPGLDLEELNTLVASLGTDTRLDLGLTVRAWTPRTPNGYIDQQITKCFADEYCTGDFILHVDSDCVAQERVRIADFFEAGQPKMLIRKWEDAGTANCWLTPTKLVLRREPNFETMAALPIIYHRSSHELFRRHIASIHKYPFVDSITRLASFSEFNAIGNFCHLYTPDAYRFIRATGPGDGFPRTIKQYWSRGTIPHEELENLLK